MLSGLELPRILLPLLPECLLTCIETGSGYHCFTFPCRQLVIASCKLRPGSLLLELMPSLPCGGLSLESEEASVGRQDALLEVGE